MRPAGAASLHKSERRQARRGTVALALAATWIAFGSSPAGTRVALETLPPLIIMGGRGILGGSILFAWGMLSGAEWPTSRQWLSSLLVGGLMLGGGAGVSTIGQRTLASGIVGVLSALMPIFAAILGYLLAGERLRRPALAGLLIGLAGVGLLVRPGSQLDAFGVALVMSAQASWALGAVLAPRLDLPAEPRMAAATELLCGGGMLVVAAVLFEPGGINFSQVGSPSWIGMLWLILTAVVGFAAYGLLVRAVPMAIATTLSYTNQIVALGLGALLFGEPTTARMIVATAVVVAGVCLIVSSKPVEEGAKPKGSEAGS